MSLISTYQGRKSLFAEKLISKGVSASGTDGLTTLINKIDDIQHFDSGLTLYADKSIAQSSDTVNLYALLLNNGKPVSGETVTFTCDAPLVTAQITSASVELYDDYFVTSTKTGSSWDYIGTGASGFVQFNSTKLNTYTSGFGTEVTHNGYIHIKDGVLTYKDTNGDAHTIDVSSIDTTKSYGSVSFTIKYYWLEGTTGSDGVASAQYTCTGAGLKTITAESGTLQSEPYTLWDTLFYDGGTSDNYNSNWTNRNNLLNVDRTTHNYTLLSETGSQYAQYTASGTYSQDIVIEFDYYYQGYGSSYVGMGGTLFNLLAYAPEDCHVKITVEGNLMTFYKDNVANATTKTKSSSDNTVAFQINDGGADIGYKNFKIYPL